MKQEESALGRWVLVDVLVDEGLSLLAIGERNYSGASVRKTLTSRLERELLLSRFKSVLHFDTDGYSGEVPFEGNQWHVEIEAIRSPVNKKTVAIRGVYVPAGESIPSKGTVGSWEWEIMALNQHAPQAIRSWWGPAMYDLYEVDPAAATSITGQPSQWVNELIVPEDRARMKVTVDGGISAANDDRHLIPYSIITNYKSGQPGRKRLEMSARLFPDDDGAPGRSWLRGITREVGYETHRVTPGLEAVRMDDLVRATFEIASDRILFCFDAEQEQIFMTSQSWKAFGLTNRADGGLDGVVHAEDFAALAAYLKGVRGGSEASGQGLELVRLREVVGGWRSFSLRAIPLNPGLDEGRYLLCRLTPR